MPEYTLKVRRYQPETGGGPYWQEFKVDLDPDLSVLDGLLQVRDRTDGTLVVRCSCRAAICGSCGMKVNGESTLGCKTRISEAHERANRRDGPEAEHPIVVEPMANMPVIKDLVTDMESTHWAKIRRVTPWLLPEGRAARARIRGAARVDDRRHPGGGLHPVRRLRLVLPVAGGRSRVHRPGGACQGVSLRGRPARLADPGAPVRPGAGPARHLRLHALLLVRGRLPQGRRADGPDHAASPLARATTTRSTTSTTAAATRRPSRRSSRRRGPWTSPCCSRSPTRRGSRAS